MNDPLFSDDPEVRASYQKKISDKVQQIMDDDRAESARRRERDAAAQGQPVVIGQQGFAGGITSAL